MGTSKAKAKTGRMAVSKYEQESTYKSASKTATKKNVPVKNLPARASKLQVNYKAGSDSEGESDDIVESADAIVPGEADESVQAVKAAGAVEAVQVEKNPIFTVFRSENKLDEGICVIRSLGDGNYELVNLNNAHHSDMAAEKTGEIIKAVPGRRDMLAIPSELWNDVQAKAEIAIKSADGRILRFFKFPPEVRNMIYKLVVIVEPHLYINRWSNLRSHLTILQTCRQMYTECSPFLWSNNFRLSQIHGRMRDIEGSFARNVKQLTLDWWSTVNKDPPTFTFLGKCPQLVELNLVVCRFSIDRHETPSRKQRLYQDEPSVRRFKHNAGLDKLVQIRGLQKVTVRADSILTPVGSQITTEELDAFEQFLTSLLTLPKPQKMIRRSRKSKAVQKA